MSIEVDVNTRTSVVIALSYVQQLVFAIGIAASIGSALDARASLAA
jgi:hypothetical protein